MAFCRYGLGLVLVLWADLLMAAVPRPEFIVRNWQLADGLPQVSAQAIAQTPDGYLWIGTQSGLARFDGITFKAYDRVTTPQLVSASVRALFVDRAGALWIGTQGGGLLRMREGRFVRPPATETLSRSGVLAFYEDRSGALWIATDNGRLHRLVGDRLDSYPDPGAPAYTNTAALTGDRDGSILIGNTRGLSRFANGRFTHVAGFGTAGSEDVYSLLTDPSGTVWVGTRGGVQRLDTGSPLGVTDEPAQSGRHPALVLLRTRAGEIWVGTRGGVQRHTASGTPGSNPESEGVVVAGLDLPPESMVLALFEDREGSVWVGTFDHGLFRLVPRSVRTISVSDGLSAEVARTVLGDRTGAQWVGTSKGLDRIGPDGITHVAREGGVSFGEVNALAEDHAGGILVGTEDGVFRIGQGASPDRPIRHLLSGYRVYSLAEAPTKDALWVGSRRGLLRLDEAGDGAAPARTLFDDVSVLELVPDVRGAVWIGTSKGLRRLGSDGVVATVSGLEHEVIMTLYRDADGTLWVGTMGSGLVHIAGHRMTRFTTADGLPDNTVCAVLEDDHKNLWMSTGRGIVRVSKASLQSLEQGRSGRLPVTVMDESDGLLTSECYGGMQPSAWKNADGSLWFAMARGVAIVDPRRLHFNPVQPHVVLEHFEVDDREVPLDGVLRFPPSSLHFAFHYTATSLVAAEKNRFKHKLEGLDRDWIEADNRRVAYYTNLPAGSYRFRVIASNNQGVWNESGAALAFSIAPHFYQRWWFFLLCGALFLGIAWSAFLLRTQQLRARNVALEIRNRLSRELHDNLSQTMHGLLMQLNAGLSLDAASGRPYFERAAQLTLEGIDETHRTLHGMRTAHLQDEGDLVGALQRNVNRLTEGTDQTVVVTTTGQKIPLPASFELELFRIAQEATTNALRHGAARRVCVMLDYANQGTGLVVQDDGCGFDPAAQPQNGLGLGLAGMRERLDALAGSLSVESVPGGGTRLSAFIPHTSGRRRR